MASLTNEMLEMVPSMSSRTTSDARHLSVSRDAADIVDALFVDSRAVWSGEGENF